MFDCFFVLCIVVIRTIETRLVSYNSRRIDLPVPDFGFGKQKDAVNGTATAEEQKVDLGQDGGELKAVQTKQTKIVDRKRKYVPGGVGEFIVAKKDDEIRGTHGVSYVCY